MTGAAKRSQALSHWENCISLSIPSAAALKVTAKATAIHQAQSFPKLDGLTSQAIWWWHTQILNANQKTQAAHEAIDHAYDFLLESIANIRDEGLRRNALNKVEDSRKLLQFWVRDGLKRKLPNERLFAHLTIKSNLRDPFKRLANTSPTPQCTENRPRDSNLSRRRSYRTQRWRTRDVDP